MGEGRLAISDFADFLLKAVLKAQWTAQKLGKDLVKIDQWEPTTKTCHLCGHVQDMPIKVRVFVCGRCGTVECRDVRRVAVSGRETPVRPLRWLVSLLPPNPTCFSRGSASTCAKSLKGFIARPTPPVRLP
jgi:hypothetical protein